jgi:ribonuclease E
LNGAEVAGRADQRPARNSERGERPARNERGGRNRSERAARPGDEVRTDDAAGASNAVQTATEAPADATDTNAESGARDENAATREKRSRDRYGRERKPRGERSERTDAGNPQAVLALEGDAVSEPELAPRKSYFSQSNPAPVLVPVAEPAPTSPNSAVTSVANAESVANVVSPVAVAPVAVVAPVLKPVASPAVAASSIPGPIGMPLVQAFELPVNELAQIATQSGLNWVNSDTAKVAAVQAVIAAEPKPVHVPRQRPAPVPQDDRPLVLVETKRDLRLTTLPFETAPTL